MRQQPETIRKNEPHAQTAARTQADGSRTSSVASNVQIANERSARSALRIKSGIRAGTAYSQCESYHGIEICRGV